jgi:alkyl hydroperoxide reductase subunit F
MQYAILFFMIYDLAIIGGGPAGVSAGVYASRKRLKTAFITDHFEGQSSVSEGIENWIGEVKIPGLELVKKLKNHLLAYSEGIIDIKEGERGQLVTKNDDGTFEIKTATATYTAKAVLICTGSYRRKLQAAGAVRFENKGVVYCASCDGPLFSGMDVVVAGGGNAAFETAAQLLAYCKSVTLINRSSNFRADPITVEKLSNNPKLTIIKNAVIKEIKGGKFVDGLTYTDIITNEDKELAIQGVFVEIGLIPNTEFVKDILSLDAYGHIIVDPRTQMTNTPGIWAAGDCTDGLYHQNNIAAGEGVKALEDIYMRLHTK